MIFSSNSFLTHVKGTVMGGGRNPAGEVYHDGGFLRRSETVDLGSLKPTLTDSSTGDPSNTIAAGVGISTWTFPLTFAKLADGDIITAFTPGFKFQILSVDVLIHNPVTTASKASTLNLEIGTTNLTGGAVALTSANATPLGVIVAGSAVGGLNTGSSSDTVSCEASSTTAFIEGNGSLVIKVQNMDTADAFAALATQQGTADETHARVLKVPAAQDNIGNVVFAVPR
ncbi:hypothetical protein LCGC14_3037440, partial [marine sediment metagenome]